MKKQLGYLSTFHTSGEIPIIREAPPIHALKEQYFPRRYPHRLRFRHVRLIVGPDPLHLSEPFLVFGPALDELECSRVGGVVEDVEERAFGLIDTALPTWS